MEEQFVVTWIDRMRKPQCEPNPAYPHGIDLDVTDGRVPNCKATLPYPAKRIGYYVVKCRVCDFRAVCTTAGRVDDPRSITVPCKIAEVTR
jgi:hypothetical protein